jgi:hypothetical protein
MMRWAWLSNGEGFIGAGQENVYLITPDLDAGLVTDVRLTRWRVAAGGRADSWETALAAARNVIILPLGRGPGRPPGKLEVTGLLDAAKRLACKYEDGEPLTGHPAWQHPPRRSPDAVKP